MMKKLLAFIIFFFSLIILTGCWDSRELTDRAIAVGNSWDVAQNGLYQVSSQFIIPSKMATGEKGGGGGEGSFFVETGYGKSVNEARNDLQKRLSRTLFKSQRQSIFIGERLAKRGIKDVLDLITRDPGGGIRTDISVVKGKQGVEVLNTTYPLENNSALALLKIHKEIDPAANATFLNLVVTSKSAASCSSIPTWTLDTSAPQGSQEPSKKGLKFAGSAIFNKDLKLVGFLNGEETNDQMWITEQLSNRDLTLFIPKGDGNVSLEVRNLKSNVHPTFHGNKMKVHLSLTGDGYLEENNTTFDLTRPSQVNIVEKAIEKQFKKNVFHLIRKVQKKYQTDIFGFGDTIFRKYPSQWKQINNEWKTIFSKADISVDVNIAIRSTGLTGASDRTSIRKAE